MFHIDSASFDNLQLSGSVVGTLSASVNFTNTTLTASIVSASNIIGSAKNARPALLIYGVDTTAYSVVSTSSVNEVAHFYTLPENYLKVGDQIFLTWEATTGETTALAKQYRAYISTTSTSSIAGATLWGIANIGINNVSVQMGKYGYITSDTTMKILGAATSFAVSPTQITAFPTDITVPHILSSWNILLAANRSGSDTTRVEWSYLQITRF